MIFTILLGISLATPLSSATPLWQNTVPSYPLLGSSFSQAMNGNKFLAAQSFQIYALGHWNSAGLPLYGNTQIGIWQNAGSVLLGTVTVSPSTPSVDGLYSYVNLSSPITLTAGQSYTIAAQNVAGQDIPTYNISVWNNYFTTNPVVTLQNGANDSGVVFHNPANLYTNAYLGNVNALIVTPEPTTYLLMGSFLGLSILAYALKKKRNKALN